MYYNCLVNIPQNTGKISRTPIVKLKDPQGSMRAG